MPHAISPTEHSSPPADLSRTTESGEDAAMPDAPQTQQTCTALDGMFDDDNDDDEFSSSPAEGAAQATPPQASQKPRYSDPETLKQFYARLFPFRPLFQWLNHSATPQNDFQHREFAFTLPNNGYVRYQSFPSADLFRKQVLQLVPERFEIGPQYSINPRDRKTVLKAGIFKPVMKELCFDIDMTDYDPIRTCCSGANICHKCWQFINMSIKVVDAALREDFGYQHIMWVYSGRRGAHAWVSDKKARELTDIKRRAIANYLSLVQSSEHGKKISIRRPLHPHLDRSLKMLNPHFTTDILIDQDPWASTQQQEKLLNALPDKTLTAALQKKWESGPGRSSQQKWMDIDSVAEAGNLSTLTPKQLVDVKQDIRLEYTYPRLDAEVSKKLNHLLKSPFVVHPGTGRVCVPIDVRRLEDFDPLAVPTVLELLDEINEWDARNPDMSAEDKARVQDWQKTSLKPYYEYFRGYVATLLKDEGRDKRGREDGDGMEF